MSGRQSSRATGRATADTTAAGGLKAAQDQIRALLADKATYKREAAAATKAAQKAAEKATREAVASALAGHQPPLRQPPQLPPDDEDPPSCHEFSPPGSRRSNQLARRCEPKNTH